MRNETVIFPINTRQEICSRTIRGYWKDNSSNIRKPKQDPVKQRTVFGELCMRPARLIFAYSPRTTYSFVIHDKDIVVADLGVTECYL